MPVVVSIGFGIMGLYLPSLIISLIADIAHKSVSKKINNLMLMLSNELYTTNNVFEAIEGTTNSVRGALSNHLEDVASDKLLALSEKEVLYNLKKRINHPSFNDFIENLEFMMINGGDISQLTDEASEELTEMNELIEKEDAEDFMMKVVVYFMILMDVGLIVFYMGSRYQVVWGGTTLWGGQTVLLLDFLFVIMIANSTITQS